MTSCSGAGAVRPAEEIRETTTKLNNTTEAEPHVLYCITSPLFRLLVCRHFKLYRLILYRTRAHHDIEPPGLNHAFHIQIQKREFARRDHKINFIVLARVERNSF